MALGFGEEGAEDRGVDLSGALNVSMLEHTYGAVCDDERKWGRLGKLLLWPRWRRSHNGFLGGRTDLGLGVNQISEENELDSVILRFASAILPLPFQSPCCLV